MYTGTLFGVTKRVLQWSTKNEQHRKIPNRLATRDQNCIEKLHLSVMMQCLKGFDGQQEMSNYLSRIRLLHKIIIVLHTLPTVIMRNSVTKTLSVEVHRSTVYQVGTRYTGPPCTRYQVLGTQAHRVLGQAQYTKNANKLKIRQALRCLYWKCIRCASPPATTEKQLSGKTGSHRLLFSSNHQNCDLDT